MSCVAIPEFVEYVISVSLKHFGMNVEAQNTLFCDSLCQEFHTCNRFAEYYRLVDFQLESTHKAKLRAEDIVLDTGSQVTNKKGSRKISRTGIY